MAERGHYKTRQQSLVEGCLRANASRYLTVDGVLAELAGNGEQVGRTTVYRRLESLASSGAVLKAVTANGEASYRLAPETPVGQLVCLDCGRVLPLDCHMLGELVEHVREHHGFAIDGSRSVLYGHCADCAGDDHE